MQVGLLGYGYWGKILSSKLEKIDGIEVMWTCTSQDKWWTNVIDLDWVFIATPNNVHYKQAKHFIEQGVNVFCEKPLTPTYKQSKKLFDLSKKHNVKLYVSDVFNFRDEVKKLKINKDIKIGVTWNKKSNNTIYDLLYHDLYLLYPILKKEIKISNPTVYNRFLNPKLTLKINNIEFSYGTLNNKLHYINNIDLTHTDNNNDALLEMISSVLDDKVDYNYNKKISLNTNRIIDLINKKNEKNSFYNRTKKTQSFKIRARKFFKYLTQRMGHTN